MVNCRKAVSGAAIPKIGYHGWKTYELAFDNVRVPAFENPEGEWGSRGRGSSGFVGIQQGLEVARAHTAARSIGLACGSLQVAMGLRQGARAIRPTNCELSGHTLQGCHHGDRNRSGKAALCTTCATK